MAQEYRFDAGVMKLLEYRQAYSTRMGKDGLDLFSLQAGNQMVSAGGGGPGGCTCC